MNFERRQAALWTEITTREAVVATHLAGQRTAFDCLTPSCVQLLPPSVKQVVEQINKHEGSAGIDRKPRSVLSARLQDPTAALMEVLTVMKVSVPQQVGNRLVYAATFPRLTGFDRSGNYSYTLTVVVELTGARDRTGQRIVRLHSFYPGHPSNVWY
jgi:hypothetical protein